MSGEDSIDAIDADDDNTTKKHSTERFSQPNTQQPVVEPFVSICGIKFDLCLIQVSKHNF